VGLEFATDMFKHVICSHQHIVVPKAKYLVAIDCKLAGSRGVVIRLREMLATVEFDYQASFDASKVGDVPCDWILAAKFVTE
jgi:hypothetical protein